MRCGRIPAGRLSAPSESVLSFRKLGRESIMETGKTVGKLMLWAVGMLVCAAGCAPSHQQNKQAMTQRWEQTSAQANIPQAEELISRGQLDKARKILNACLDVSSPQPAVYFLMGQIDMMEGRTEQARQNLQQAVQLDPELDKGWYFLGTLAVLDKDYVKAMEYTQKALDLQPANTDYILTLADICIEGGRIEQAEKILDQGLKLQSGNLDLMLAKARLLQQSGLRTQALLLYEQALLMHGAVAAILEPCAYAYLAEGQWQQAADKFEQLLPLYKQDLDRYNTTMRSLALALFNAGRYGQALVYYDKLSVVYRQDADIWLMMAHSAMGVDDAKRALQCAQQALKYHPSWASAYAVSGCARYFLGEYEQAVQDYAKIINHEELGAFAWFMTGRCYQQLGQPIQANAAYERAETINPNNELIKSFLKRTLKSL